jgi:23S rRNA (cytosine1962-C5)-methyltransferase
MSLKAMHTPYAIIHPRGERRIRDGHPWVFHGDVLSLEGADQGDRVALYTKDKTFLAWGFYSRRSRITFRIISRDPEPIDSVYWEKALAKALKRREGLIAKDRACRLVFSEADGIPGLIADWYSGHVVIQSLIPGIDKIIEQLKEILIKLLDPKSLLLRNDLEVRSLEELPLETRVIYGTLPESVRFQEGLVLFETPLMTGQKTGAYLDQRENRLFLGEWVRKGGRVLDAFCYQGGFALHLAEKAASVLAVDDSAPAIEAAKKNMEINGVNNITFRKDNIFDFLKRADEGGERFDLIVLDPPPFAKKRADLPGAIRGYTELNRRALRCLNPDGLLNTYSCSYHITESLFGEILATAAKKAGVQALLLAKNFQAHDHPISLNFPESLYLKGLLLKKVVS